MQLKGKTALVTGASGGLGAATVLRLAQEGADIVFTFAHDEKGAGETAKKLDSMGANCVMLKADLSTMDGVNRLVDATYERVKKVDILVNNAGVFLDQPFFEITEENFDTTIAVNLKAPFFLSQKIASRMKASGIKGRIINISSGASKRVSGICASYCAAKGGVNVMTKSLAENLGPYGITVNAILPGPIETKINAHQFRDPDTRDMLLTSTKLNEFGQTEYVAEAVLYYASEGAKWTTGTLLEVDGGFTCS